jgi:DNA-binding NtrC family response regulator
VREHQSHYERELIVKALQETKGNVSKSAQLLGLSRKGLQLKLKELNIDKVHFEE